MDEDNRKKWEMPEPIFRRSTGELVSPADGSYFDPEPDTLEPNSPAEGGRDPMIAPDPPEPSASALPETLDPLAKLYDPPQNAKGSTAKAPPLPAPAAAVEPQPYISEQFTSEKPAVGTDVSPAKGSSRSIWISIALLAVLAVVGGFAALMYFMFFAARTNTDGF